MQFEKGYIYHIYNQGNNRRKIFFDRENYLYFLRKINTYILPYADVLAWCLMPNHFHLMVYVREVDLNIGVVTDSNIHQIKSIGVVTHQMTPSHQMSKKRTLTNSIAIMLRSYTRAINKKFNTSGTLFRPHTKAECVNCPKGITPSFIIKDGITNINISLVEEQYPQVCFNYIHQNPVKAKLVDKTTDWEFSSAVDYAHLRQGHLINKTVAEEYVDIN